MTPVSSAQITCKVLTKPCVTEGLLAMCIVCMSHAPLGMQDLLSREAQASSVLMRLQIESQAVEAAHMLEQFEGSVAALREIERQYSVLQVCASADSKEHVYIYI